MMKRIYKILIIIICPVVLISCQSKSDTDIPKPRGYFRLELPVKKYVRFDSIYPYSFDYPVYGKIVARTDKNSEFGWINIVFPSLHGEINVSYKPVNNNLSKLLKDSHEFAGKHVQKATEINQTNIVKTKERVFGTLYEIKGSHSASVYQFILTDSTKHFFRGALYFNSVPNNDSLSPVLDFIKLDIDRLITSFKWKS